MAADTLSPTRKTPLASEPLLMFAAGLAALYFGRDIFIPLAMALTLSFLLTPAVMRLERMHLKRGPSVILVVVAAFGVLTVIGWVVSVQMLSVVNALPNYRDNIESKINSIHVPASGPLGQAVSSIKKLSDDLSGAMPVPTQPAAQPIEPPTFRHMTRNDLEKEILRLEAQSQSKGSNAPAQVQVVTPPQSLPAYLGSLLLPVVKPLGIFAIVVVFTVYMLFKREDLRNRVLLLAGEGQINVMTRALNDAGQRISTYLIMNVLVNTAYGIVIGMGLYLLHVPNATLWGVLFGLLRLVPYFGVLVAGSATVIFTLAVFPGWWHPLFVAVLFIATESLVSNFVEPWLYGTHTGVSPLALLVTALIWTLLWGWAGLILSTPLTVCLIVVGRYLPQLRFLYVLLGEEAELAPEAAFYERLLAMDHASARKIAGRFLDGRTLVDLYDSVLLPALMLAEQDKKKGNLDDVRSSYLYQSVTEVMAEHGDAKNVWPERLQLAAQRAIQYKGCPIVCVAAHDEADELAAMMVAQLLERAGRHTMVLAASALTPEILERLGQDQNTSALLSALPPFAFAHARGLCQQIREQMPKNRLVVGLWGAEGDPEDIRSRFGRSRPTAIVTDLEQSLLQLLECRPVRAVEGANETATAG
ncbi:MAG: AI-2E family transporter [Acidobacteriaceae bacterium]